MMQGGVVPFGGPGVGLNHVGRNLAPAGLFCFGMFLGDFGYDRLTSPDQKSKLHWQETPNSVGGRKPMYKIQAAVAVKQ